MPYAELRNGRIEVETSYTDRERMLMVPGSTYKKQFWAVPLSWASCIVLRNIFGTELELGPELITWAGRERKRIERALQLRELLELPPDSPGAKYIDAVEDRVGGRRLRGFQRVDVAYLITMEKAGLFQPMGAGKTAVLIRTLQVLAELGKNPFPAVIIAPNSVKATVWPKELAEWAPELSVSVVDGGATARRKKIFERADVTVINWEAVRLHSRVSGYGDIRLTDKDKLEKELNELAPRTVIMDESHRLRDPKSAQSRAVKYVAHQARFRFALTGTPVNDHAGDLWGLLHVVSPDWHPGHTRYMERWVLTGFSLYGGMTILGLNPANEPEFRQVTLPLYRRLPKEIILPELPEMLPEITRLTPMTPKQAKAYHEMEKNQLAQLNELLVAGTPLSAFTRLLQFAAATATVNKTWVDEQTGKVKYDISLTDPSGKVDDLVELLEEMGDEPLGVGAVSAELIWLAAERLRSLGITYGVIAGAVSSADRAKAVQQFQAGEIRVIFIVLSAGAEGLTLTRARVGLLMQEDFRPDLNEQFKNRFHRIGSEVHGQRGVQIIKQITPGTVEERKPALLAAKNGRIQEILEDEALVRKLLGG